MCIRLAVLLVFGAALYGCAAMGVPITSDPAEKLGWARFLYEKQNRPLPAERLILEARDIYQSKNDELGLAEAFRQYAFFLVSKTVEDWEPIYRRNGFLDQSVIFDSRHERAIEYFEKAKVIYIKNADYGSLTNVDLVIGHVYLSKIGNENRACRQYEQSLADHKEFRKHNPNDKIVLPNGFNSYEEYIEAIKKGAKCV